MDVSDKDRFVDELLDASLRNYRNGDPRTGLEGRILAAVRAHERAVRRRIWIWAGAVATAGVVTIAVWFTVPRRQFTPPPSSGSRAASESAPAVVGERPVPRPAKAVHRARREHAASRRPEQFPTPRPLTSDEKLLLLYVKQTPGSELEVEGGRLSEDVQIPQLSIAELEIKPLPSLEVGPDE